MIKPNPDYSPKDPAPLYVVGLSTGAILHVTARLASGRGLGPLELQLARTPFAALRTAGLLKGLT